MAKPTSVVNLDPIDRKQRQQGMIGRFLITRWSGGKSVVKTEPYGHYMFCGAQRSGKTASVLWYAERLAKKYQKKRIGLLVHKGCNHNESIFKCRIEKFDTPPTVRLWGNFGVGTPFKKEDIYQLIDELDPYANEVRIFLIDEVHTYFPKEGVDKETKQLINRLNGLFSQLAKRNVYLLSTAQIYGRLDKALREQCLYMIDCKVSPINHKLVNEFIKQEDIIADDLGRWAGNPFRIYKHGLSNMQYDTKRLIRE